MPSEIEQREDLERLAAVMADAVPALGRQAIYLALLQARLQRGRPGRDAASIEDELALLKAETGQFIHPTSPTEGEPIGSDRSAGGSSIRTAWDLVGIPLAAAAVGAAIAATGQVWIFAGVLVAGATVGAWMSKLEHDRRFRESVELAREAAIRAGASLQALDQALNG